MVERPLPRRAAVTIATGFAALALGACSPGTSRSTPAARPAPQPPGFIPTPEHPRTDGRLTLIWFYEPE